MYDIKKDKPFYHTLRTLIFSLLYSTNHDKKYMRRFLENTVGGIIVFVGFFVGIFILCHAGEKIAQLVDSPRHKLLLEKG
ncbi:uncharacterized protein LOC114342025 [Diabrotica virgifera virgifera]|uniref:Uncharacterized protein n=1 Tax=Diabrotica virgifera virgifera TaxID=50390 RepID=A0ABM5KY68_DIAVI|nr:uncharacterized protein LOC114342025 [Diabrotica virgifera virgifera]